MLHAEMEKHIAAADSFSRSLLNILTLWMILGIPIIGNSQNHSDLRDSVSLLNNKAEDVFKNNSDQAFLLVTRALNLSDEIGLNEEKVNSLILLAKISSHQGKYESASEYIEQAMTTATDNNDKLSVAKTLDALGILYLDMGNFLQAAEQHKKAFTMFVQLKSVKGVIACANSLASVYSKSAKYEDAIPYYFQALALAESENDELSMAKIYLNLGVLYTSLEDVDMAIEYLNKAKEIFRTYEDKRNLAIIYNNIGNVGFYTGDFEMAIENYEAALKTNNELNDILGMSMNYNNLAALYASMGSTDKARGYIAKAEALFDGNDTLKKELIQTQVNLSGILFSEGKYDQSVQSLLNAGELARKENLLFDLKEIYYNLYFVYESQKDYENALSAYKNYKAYNDSLDVNENVHKLQMADAKHAIERNRLNLQNSEQKRSILIQQNQIKDLEISRRNYWIVVIAMGAIIILLIIGVYFWRQKVLNEKKRAEYDKNKSDLEQRVLHARMNPHFVFNSLNSIQRLYMEGDLVKANEYLAEFGNLLRRTLENSLKESITLKEEIETLEIYLMLEKVRTAPALSYEINISNELLDSEISIMPFIIQPFVENAIWHGILPKESPGKVTISVKHENDILICEVIDDGVGINSNQGNDGKSHNSFGIKTTEARLGSKGSVDLIDLNSGGTKVIIKIPIVI